MDVSQEPGRIAILLPYAEHFTARKAGAVSLCIRDAARNSRFRDEIDVFGKPVEQPFEEVAFQPLKPSGQWLRGRNLGLAARFIRHVRERAPALIEVHNRPLVFDYLADRIGSTPITLHLHNDPTGMKGSRSPAERKSIAGRAAAIYCVSDYIRRRFLDGLNVDPGNVFVLYNGVERPWSSPPAKEKLILFVGRTVQDKGAMEFAEAVAAVLARHPEWRAAIVGSRWPGDERMEAYERAVYERFRAIGPAASFLGFRPHTEVMDLYAKAAIACVPSLWNDPFPRTAIEAIAAGSALVTTARGGLPEVAEGRGLILEEPTVAALASAFDRLISSDEERLHLQRRAWEDFPFLIERQAEIQDALRERILLHAHPDQESASGE